MVEFKDIGEVSKRKFTPEGFLLVTARIARTGIQEYSELELGDACPKELRDNGRAVIRLLRPESEVFDAQSMGTFANKPVTNNHPDKFVDSTNVTKLQVGFSKDSISREENKLVAELVIQDRKAIEDIKRGKNQVSLGYLSDIDWVSGVDPEFGPYDGIQTNIRGNHIAIVNAGKAGYEVKLDDTKEPLSTKLNGGNKKMATRIIDGITIEVTDQAGEAIDKLTKELKDSKKANESLKAKLEDSKKEIDMVKGELDAEKAKALDTKQIDALVTARVNLIDTAKKLVSDIETDGKSEIEIKKECITKLADSIDLADKSDDYVTACFDTLVKTHKPTESKKIADALKHNEGGSELTDSEKARERMLKRNQSAYRGGEDK